MRLPAFLHTLPRWTQALAIATLIGAATLYAGVKLHQHLLLLKLDRSVAGALDSTWADLAQLLEDARATLTNIQPLAGLRCESRVLAAMRREVDLRPGIRSAFIVRDDGLGCSTYEGAYEALPPLQQPLPSGVRLTHADGESAPESLMYTRVHPPYTINSVVYDEAIDRVLRRSGEDVQMILQIGDAFLDESTRQWQRRGDSSLALGQVRLSAEYPLALHGGLYDAQLALVQQRELTAVLGRLMFISVLVAGLVFTVLYNGTWLRRPRALVG